MAFVSQLPTTQEWARWTQDRQPPGWLQSSQMRYDHRPLQAYTIEPPYNASAFTNLAHPQYSGHNLMPYLDQPTPATPEAFPLRHPFANTLEDVRNGPVKLEPDTTPFSFEDVKPSDQSKDEHSPAKCTIAIDLGTPSKTIRRNDTINPSDRVEFSTAIDNLMRAVRSEGQESNAQTQLPSPAASPVNKTSPDLDFNSVTIPELGSKKPPKVKQFICDGPGCGAVFSQKTHYEIHRRTHTGERPFKCTFPGCGHSTTQSGNLKNHERRHTGERPYKCEHCNKSFAHKGNAKTHERTHKSGKNLFTCILDNCGKTFTTLGNMKSHQNNFHTDTLLYLTRKFIDFSANGYIPQEYRELHDYFTAVYKNTNKGIKGRGKNTMAASKGGNKVFRKVAGRSKGPKKTISAPSPPSSVCEPRTPASEPEYTIADDKPFIYGLDVHPAQLMTPRSEFGSASHFGPEYSLASSPSTVFDESRRSSYSYM